MSSPSPPLPPISEKGRLRDAARELERERERLEELDAIAKFEKEIGLSWHACVGAYLRPPAPQEPAPEEEEAPIKEGE